MNNIDKTTVDEDAGIGIILQSQTLLIAYPFHNDNCMPNDASANKSNKNNILLSSRVTSVHAIQHHK